MRKSLRELRHYLRYHFAPLIGQPHAEAFVGDRKAAVVEAEQVQDRGVQVVDVDRVFDDVPADLVGLAESGRP